MEAAPLKEIIRYEEELKDKVQRVENLILEDAHRNPEMKELIAEEQKLVTSS